MWELFKFNMICSHFLSFERCKVLLRYSSTALRAYKDREMFGLKVSSHFTVGTNSRPTPAPPRPTQAQTIPFLSDEGWDAALLHLWMTLSLCVSYTVLGRLGMKSSNANEWQFNQRPFSRCPVSVAIKLLHFTWPPRWWAAEALNEGWLFVFNKLSMKERQKHKEPERGEREQLCVFLPLVLDYKNA